MKDGSYTYYTPGAFPGGFIGPNRTDRLSVAGTTLSNGKKSMLLERLHLRNYGRHHDLTIDFKPQLNAIVGRNGAGKTTILDALLFLLSGINRAVGKNEDNVSQYAKPGEPAFAELVFSHNGEQLRLKRGLQPNTADLVIDKDRVRGITACNNAVLAKLGVTPNQLNDYVFVEQRRIDSWFDKAPSARAEDMTSLFGATGAESAYKALLKAQPISVPQLPENMGNVLQELSQVQQQVLELQGRRGGFSDLPEKPADRLDQLNAKIREYHQRTGLQVQIDSRRRDLETFNRELTQVTGSLEASLRDIAELEQAVLPWRQAATTANRLLAQWATYHKANFARRAYQRDLATFSAQVKSRMLLPVKPADLVLPDDTQFQLTLAQLQPAAAEAEMMCNQLKRLQPGQPCPTCGSEPANIAAHLEQHSQRLASLQQELFPLLERQRKTTAYHAAVEQCRQNRRALKQQLRGLKQARRALLACDAPQTPEHELHQTRADAKIVEDGLQAAGNVRDSLQRKQQDLIAAINQAAADLKHYESLPPPLSPQELQTVEAEVQRINDRLTERAALDSEIKVLEERARGLQQRADIIRDTVKRAAGIQHASTRLKQVAEILHHTAAPRILTQTRLEAMLDEVNASLGLLEAPFRVALDEALTFWAEFLDGTVRQPDRRLSVGQRITLAIALRIAMNSTLVGDLGLLILDEPTAGLDAETLACVPAAIARLREISESRGLQVLFVTHEQALIEKFENVIAL